MSVTTDYQLELRGLLTGEGQTWEVVEIDGLGTPEVRAVDRDHGTRDGGYLAGLERYTSRTIVATLEATAEDPAALWTPKRELKAAWARSLDPVTLELHAFGEALQIVGHPRGATWSETGTGQRARARVEFWAPDPRLYSTTLQTQAFTTEGPQGGVVWPIVWDLDWATVSNPSEATLVNAGDTDAKVVWALEGPCVKPRVELVDAGLILEFDLTLATGQTLTVDTFDRTAKIGTVGRSGSTTARSVWWDLPPGGSLVRVGAYAGLATFTASWRAAQ